jgi:hypothetical protein
MNLRELIHQEIEAFTDPGGVQWVIAAGETRGKVTLHV